MISDLFGQQSVNCVGLGQCRLEIVAGERGIGDNLNARVETKGEAISEIADRLTVWVVCEGSL